VSRNFRTSVGNIIRVDDPKQALIAVLDLFYPLPERKVGIDPRAIVSSSAQLGDAVFIGPGAYVGANAIIGARVTVHPNVYVGDFICLGEDSEVFPNVAIYGGTHIGKRVRIHSGTVIGSDGFGYARLASGVYQKIRQAGTVEIGDDVEIGSNCSIDRATLGTTRIASGTKIDNLVQIGHNSEIGRDCCLIAQVGISGSVRIGDGSVLAGQVGVSDHVTLAAGTIVGAQSGVKNNVGPGEWLGTPAIPADRARRVYFVWERLAQFRKEFLELKGRCDQLEKRLYALEGLGSVIK
jgi:UDP-3-O-[3-hydroxymyristoyl] glucosamine N-acyltransferase